MRTLPLFAIWVLGAMMVGREPAALGTEQEASGTTATTVVRTSVVEDLSTGDFRACRKMITGPDVNQHPPYPGCTGFVGWESVMRRSSGEMLCSFSAGYWHVSNPTPIDFEPETLKSWKAVGFRTDIDAPTGGRALICRSNDDGKTWSQPVTLVDTPGDDRHPVIVELPDDSLLCVFFVIDNWYGYDAPPKGRHKNSRVASIRSTDGGKTWSEPVYMPSPFKYYDRMCGKPSVLPSGRVILPTYGKDSWTDSPEQLGVYASDDFGKSWKFLSRLKSGDGALDEPAITRAHDGTLVMIARPDGTVIADARTELDEFELRVGPVLTDDERADDIETLGGLIFMMLDRVPGRGEIVKHSSGIEFEIIDADPRRIKRVRLRNLPALRTDQGADGS